MNDKRLYCPGLVNNREEVFYFMLFDGVTLERNGVCMCDLRFIMDEYRYNKEPMIQIHSKDFSKIYSSPKSAVEKFLEIS